MQEARLEIRAVGQTETRSNRPVEAALVPMFGWDEADRAGLINDWSCRQWRARNGCGCHVDVGMRRRIRGWIDFPTRAIVQS